MATWKEIIELVATSVMPLGILGLLWNRYYLQRGIGKRSIQFAVVTLVLPSILILAMEGILNTDVVATLLGTIVGYSLSGLADEDKEGKNGGATTTK